MKIDGWIIVIIRIWHSSEIFSNYKLTFAMKIVHYTTLKLSCKESIVNIINQYLKSPELCLGNVLIYNYFS